MKKIYTLCIVQRGDEVLLGMKKRGFGEGNWNGFGGKSHDGETIEAATKRELLEEVGITAHDLTKRAVMTFMFASDPLPLEVHVFTVARFTGDPVESEEMRPQWFHRDAIPFDFMWPGDRYWYPLLFAGKNFTGEFYFKDMKTLLRHEVREI